MDCCDWFWFTESLDDLSIPLVAQPVAPRRADGFSRFTMNAVLPRRRASLSAWLLRGLDMLRVNRRVVVGRDALSHMDRGLGHNRESQETKVV